MPDITWIAAAPGQASEPTNWSLGRAPENGDRVIWDNTSDNNCSWDLDALTVTADGWVISTGYDGVVAQAATADIGIGAGGYSQAAGTATFNASKWVYCAGDFVQTGGAYGANTLRLVMTGGNKTINSVGMGTIPPYSLTINNDTSLISTIGVAVDFTVASGKVLNISSTNDLRFNAYNGGTWSNGGTVNGPGTVSYYTKSTVTPAPILGAINANLTIAMPATSASNAIVSLGANTALGGALTVRSEHTSNTITLAHGSNYTLSVAGAVTIGARGVMIQGTGQWTFGSYTQNGASSVFTQGGPVSVTGDTAISDGTLTGLATSTWTCGGNLTQTAGAITIASINIKMTGTGKTLTFAGYPILKSLRISGMVTHTGGTGPTIDSGGLLVDAGATFQNSMLLSIRGYTGYKVIENSGAIVGNLTITIAVSNDPPAFNPGQCSAPLTISLLSGASASRTLSLNTPWSGLNASLVVFSAHATNTMTLDLAGYSLQCNGITAGTRGVILFKSGKVVNRGNLDTSAGSVDFGTSQYVQAAPGTIKLAAGQSLNDLIVRSGAAGSSLLSDVTVNGIYAHVPEIAQGAFALTVGEGKEYTGKRRPLRKRIVKRIVWPSLADKMLLEDLEVPA